MSDQVRLAPNPHVLVSPSVVPKSIAATTEAVGEVGDSLGADAIGAPCLQSQASAVHRTSIAVRLSVLSDASTRTDPESPAADGGSVKLQIPSELAVVTLPSCQAPGS